MPSDPANRPNLPENSPDAELLRIGARQLAEDIVRISKAQEASAVTEYLGAILADTEGRVPAAERKVTVKVLAAEQREEIVRSLLSAGGSMLEKLDDNSSKSHAELDRTAKVATRSIQVAQGTHQHDVGTYVRQGNLGRAQRGHDAAAVEARSCNQAINQHVDTLGTWARVQRQETEQFDENIRRGEAHAHALNGADRVVSPDYTGGPKDLSMAIDKAVKVATGAKLQEAVVQAQAAGRVPEDALVELLLDRVDDAVDPRAAETIAALRKFAAEYADATKAGHARVAAEAQEAGRSINKFASQGNDGYRSARRNEDAQELYGRQSRTLNAAATHADAAIKQSKRVIDVADQELQHTRRQFTKLTDEQ